MCFDGSYSKREQEQDTKLVGRPRDNEVEGNHNTTLSCQGYKPTQIRHHKVISGKYDKSLIVGKMPMFSET